MRKRKHKPVCGGRIVAGMVPGIRRTAKPGQRVPPPKYVGRCPLRL